jgi:hypothetical protein
MFAAPCIQRRKEGSMANRIRNLVLGAAVLIAGIVGLFLPVSTWDGSSSIIACGNAVSADLSAARTANEKTPANIPVLNEVVPHPDYVAHCESAISGRRHWAIPLTIVGAVGVLVGSLYRGRRAGQPGRR